MRICLLTPNFPPMSWPCGAAHFIARYGEQLAARGHAVAVVTSNAAAAPVAGVRLVVEPGDWKIPHMRRLVAAAAATGAELVDFQYEAAMFSARWWPLALPYLARGAHAKRILTLHSQDLPQPGGRLWRPLQLLGYDGVFFYSEAFLGRMQRRFPSRAGRFGLRGFPANVTRAGSAEALGLIGKIRAFYSDSAPLLVYFGHINPGRGIEDVLEATRRQPRARLFLLSQFAPETDDYHRRLVAWCDAHGMRDRVSFTGRLGDEQVSVLLQAADAVVLPFPDGASFKNGSLAAAVTHGAAVVTTAGELTESALRACKGIRFYPAGDVSALAAAIEGLVFDEAALRESRRAVTALSEHFSWSLYLDERERFYERILGGGGAR